MAREQIKLTYQIGTDKWRGHKEQIKLVLASRASTHCGGCTVSNVTGYWREDGDVKKETFEGRLEREEVVQIELTCEPAKSSSAEEHMKEIISTVFRAYPEIDVDWVHVSATVMEGRHFSVKAINEGRT